VLINADDKDEGDPLWTRFDLAPHRPSFSGGFPGCRPGAARLPRGQPPVVLTFGNGEPPRLLGRAEFLDWFETPGRTGRPPVREEGGRPSSLKPWPAWAASPSSPRPAAAGFLLLGLSLSRAGRVGYAYLLGVAWVAGGLYRRLAPLPTCPSTGRAPWPSWPSPGRRAGSVGLAASPSQGGGRGGRRLPLSILLR